MSKPSIRIITTSDGSHSLLREDLNETYHSFHGARSESEHVFIKTGLEYFLFNPSAESVKIFEVGLGTGLNALLAGLYAREKDVMIDFHSLEPMPVGKDIYSKLNYGDDDASRQLLQQIHESPWSEKVQVHANFQLSKYITSLEDYAGEQGFDIIFFDAFAPSKQPEVWSLENIKRCFALLSSGGILTTYCAQGQFKRNLKEAGFEVETLKGALGKKEMVRAHKP